MRYRDPSRWAPALPPHVRDGWGPPMGIMRPYVGSAYVGAPTQQELFDLEKVHAEAAETAEVEERWADAAKEWDLAAALSSQYAVDASLVEHEKAHQRFKEYKRRADLARAKLAESAAPSPSSIATIVVALALGGALGLYLLEPAIARSLLSRAGAALGRLPQIAKKVLP